MIPYELVIHTPMIVILYAEFCDEQERNQKMLSYLFVLGISSIQEVCSVEQTGGMGTGQ